MIETGRISTSADFATHVRLVWSNAMEYNQQGSEIYATAEKLSKLSEKKMVFATL
jgi:hypothetical protein